jgi:hypothetical protein
MHEKFLAEIVDNSLLVMHVARIKWVTNACKILAERIADRLLVGHVDA